MILRNRIPVTIYPLRTIYLICFFASISFSIISGQEKKEDNFPYDQPEQTPPVKDRLIFGGSFGLMFGTITDIQVSPIVGFWVLPRIALAAGPTYRFYKDQVDRTSIYGGRGYMQFVVIQDLGKFFPGGLNTGIFLHVEDELLSLKANFWKYPLNPRGRFYVNTVLAGGGISQQIGRKGSINLMLLWPLNDPTYNLYSKPELRVSFTF
jgi:hypothetical protein